MICYRDMTFCVEQSCRHFDIDCFRSLTDRVKEDAREWWGSDEYPIAIFLDTPKCYEEKE